MVLYHHTKNHLQRSNGSRDIQIWLFSCLKLSDYVSFYLNISDYVLFGVFFLWFCIIMQKIISNGQTVLEIFKFDFFHALTSVTMSHFTLTSVTMCRSVYSFYGSTSSYKKSSQTVKRFSGYSNLTFFSHDLPPGACLGPFWAQMPKFGPNGIFFRKIPKVTFLCFWIHDSLEKISHICRTVQEIFKFEESSDLIGRELKSK